MANYGCLIKALLKKQNYKNKKDYFGGNHN